MHNQEDTQVHVHFEKTSHDFFSKSNCRKHSVYIYNVIGKKTKLFMEFNYLEITFKNGTCNSPSKIAQPNYCTVGIWGFGDNTCFEKNI